MQTQSSTNKFGFCYLESNVRRLLSASDYCRALFRCLNCAKRFDYRGLGCSRNFKVKNDHRSKFSNLSNWKEEAWKIQGFNGIRTRDLRDTGAMLYQLSYKATHWERGQFIESISREECNDVKYIWNNSYIWTAVVDQSEEWSSQWIFQFEKLERRSLKNSRLQ